MAEGPRAWVETELRRIRELVTHRLRIPKLVFKASSNHPAAFVPQIASSRKGAEPSRAYRKELDFRGVERQHADYQIQSQFNCCGWKSTNDTSAVPPNCISLFPERNRPSFEAIDESLNSHLSTLGMIGVGLAISGLACILQ
jgi:hypothetical protein